MQRMLNIIRQWLRSTAWLILATVKPSDDETDKALRAAFADCGLNQADYAHDLDLGPKRFEVLVHAANRLGNPLRTVADLKNVLR